MSTYAIGDIQGCYAELQDLLEKITFDPKHDELWFVGDLVNRGPQSLETLRFIKSLGSRAKVTLGNHDIHLLAVYYGTRKTKPQDTLNEVLNAHDAKELMNWLRLQPLLHHDPKLNFTMVHAGIAPQWDLVKAKQLSDEYVAAMQTSDIGQFLDELFSDSIGSNSWDDNLTGINRIRTITNYFTRMRFCDARGKLDLKTKGPMNAAPEGFTPWFKAPNRKMANDNIVFGHWAMLKGETDTPHVYAIDTGCAWGEKLTAMRLKDLTRFNVKAHNM